MGAANHWNTLGSHSVAHCILLRSWITRHVWETHHCSTWFSLYLSLSEQLLRGQLQPTWKPYSVYRLNAKFPRNN